MVGRFSRMRSFTHLMPGEQQSCVGCHTNRNTIAPDTSARPLAAVPRTGTHAARVGRVRFQLSPCRAAGARSVLRRMPHARLPDGGVDLCGDRTDFFNVSYETLARKGNPGENPYTKWIPSFNGQEANILQVTPRYWGSPASRLADIVLNGHPDDSGKPRIDVDPVSQRRVFAWIDLNVPYYGTSESNNIDLVGCRQMVPGELDQVLTQVIARRVGRATSRTRGLHADHERREQLVPARAARARREAPSGAANRSSHPRTIPTIRPSSARLSRWVLCSNRARVRIWSS